MLIRLLVHLQVLLWKLRRGDQTLRLDYPLTDQSIVFDCGGYLGDWAAAMSQRYHSQIFIFEPLASFAEKIEKRFADQKKITVCPFGVGAKDGTLKLAVAADATGAYAAGEQLVEAPIRSLSDFMRQRKIDRVDLMKLNIEGGEYDLLEHLLTEGFIDRFKAIQVQFHWFAPQAIERRRIIRKQLQQTHRCIYNFPFVWESWQHLP